LTTSLRMVWCSDVVLGAKLLEKVPEGLIDEMRPFVTYKHLASALGVGNSARKCFHPFGDVVHSDQDVLAIMGFFEWPHENNAPYVEQFNLMVVCEWHCIASSDATLHLAFSTSSNELSGVFIHYWPEETTLPNLCLSLECPKVASVGCGVAFFDDLYPFCCWYTPP
jgi:hypothetical protein